MTITINNTDYTFNKSNLKYGKKKELEEKSFTVMDFTDGKPVVKDPKRMVAVEYIIREEIAKICFSIPDDVNLDDVEAETVEIMFDCLINAGLVRGEKKNQTQN
jgi:hypothetical protein